MIKIQANLCIGCGRCADECPQQAISIVNGQAWINQKLCTGCRLCIELCPQGAIIELAAVSKEKLLVTIDSLKQKTDDLVERIERLRQKAAK
jgi:electron transport complex protein RnfB